jgi:tryptophanyl-tRNA synthetase
MRILSGIQPSGKLHLGNYFGMMQPALELQAKGDVPTSSPTTMP